MKLFLKTLILSGLLLNSTAYAHFIWISGSGERVSLNFGELADAPEPELLEKIEAVRVWARVRGDRRGTETRPVTVNLENDSLSGPLESGSSVVLASHDYGVITRGDSTFLLRYLAKQHLSPLPGQWTAVNDSDRLPLEITPSLLGQTLTLTVTHRQKPAGNIEVRVQGGGLDETLTTDDTGVVLCQPHLSGILSVRAKLVETTAGELSGEKYDSVRTYSTLTLPLSRPVFESLSHRIPALPRGVTSFGAAISGDFLYVYGGHFGQAHHYSEAGQSNDFLRISLIAESPEWERLASGPKLTGLALVESGGKLYRIGGFSATNGDEEDQSLWSQNSFACFDPETGAWTELTPLPSGRSSHDAAVINGRVYVAGGWNMQGPGRTEWHTTALVCDLNQQSLSWEELPTPPFQRRAVSLAAYKNRLYVIGGMQESGGTVLDVGIFDPSNGTWTAGPELQGSGMEGFGTSSFAAGDRLIVTTMSGAVQTLDPHTSRWTVAGQLQEPRFFHRQLTGPDGRIVVVGGASMESGKTDSVELLRCVSDE